jgi:hypothetical protein
MSDYLNYYEIQHTNTDFENLIHYLQDAVKEGNLQIKKEVVDGIIEITNKQELFEDELEKSYDEGYSEGYKDGEDEAESDGYQDGYSDGYEKAKAEFESPNIEKLKKEIEDEYYQKGYISADVYYQKIVPNRKSNFKNKKDITPDDLPF